MAAHAVGRADDYLGSRSISEFVTCARAAGVLVLLIELAVDLSLLVSEFLDRGVELLLLIVVFLVG